MTYFVSLLHTINPLFFALLAVLALLLWKAIYTFKTYPDDPELRRNAIKEMSVGGLVLILILGIFVVVPLVAGITVKDDELSLRLPTGFTFETYPEADILSDSTPLESSQMDELLPLLKGVSTVLSRYREEPRFAEKRVVVESRVVDRG